MYFNFILQPRIKKLVSLYHTYSDEDLKRKSFTRSIAFGIEKLPAGIKFNYINQDFITSTPSHVLIKVISLGTFAIGEYITKEASLDYTIMLEEFYFEQCIMMMRKSSPYTKKLSDLIGRLHESGLLLAWETQVYTFFYDINSTSPQCATP